MYTKETSSPLLAQTRTVFQNDTPFKSLKTPIQQYNYVIENYNIEENRVKNIFLDSISESALFVYFWKIYSSSWFLIVTLGLILVPVLGIILYAGLTFGVVVYFSALQIFNKNQSKVQDPFEKMIFCPEICRMSNVPNKFFEVRAEEVEGFSFHPEIIEQIKQRSEDDEVKFMVYDCSFWDYYHNLPKYKGSIIALWILASALVIIQGIHLKDMMSETKETS